MPLTGWPPITDDDGTGQSGTPVDKTWSDAVLESIENSMFSGTNPSIPPADIIDEVVDARGNESSLSDRLDGVIDLDGDLIIPSELVTETEFKNSRGGDNLIMNDQFLLWPNGDAAAPSAWALDGAGGTIARTGSSLGDVNRKHGKFSAKLTNAGGVKTTLMQTLLDSAVVADPGLANSKISVGVRVKTNTGSRATVSVSDGITETASSAHSGNAVGGGDADGWEWLTVTHTISPSATQLAVILNISAGSVISVYWSGVVSVLSEIAPSGWFPAKMEARTERHYYAGAVATGTDIVRFIFEQYGIIRDCQLSIKTIPTGANLIVDVNTWDGAAFTTAFTTKPTIVVAVSIRGGAAPDGTYARRCLAPQIGAVAAVGGEISIDIDQVGSGVPGSDLQIVVRYLVYVSPFASLRAYDDVA